MRHLVVLIAAGLTTACTSTLLDEPSILVSPYLAVYQLRGSIGLQTQGANPGDPPQNNAPQLLRTFGQEHHHEDVGVRADIGDGFGGLRIDYYRLDMGTSRYGTLTSDWGRLQTGDEVDMRAEMDDLRIGWVEPLMNLRTEYRDAPVKLSFGAGGVFQYRNMTLRGRTIDLARSQNVQIEGDVVYVAVRARAEYRDFMLDLDYEFSPNLVLSGDYDGIQQNFEARVSYGLQQRDIRVFAGYRYAKMPAKGDADGLAFDSDIILDGFQFGVTFTF